MSINCPFDHTQTNIYSSPSESITNDKSIELLVNSGKIMEMSGLFQSQVVAKTKIDGYDLFMHSFHGAEEIFKSFTYLLSLKNLLDSKYGIIIPNNNSDLLVVDHKETFSNLMNINHLFEKLTTIPLESLEFFNIPNGVILNLKASALFRSDCMDPYILELFLKVNVSQDCDLDSIYNYLHARQKLCDDAINILNNQPLISEISKFTDYIRKQIRLKAKKILTDILSKIDDGYELQQLYHDTVNKYLAAKHIFPKDEQMFSYYSDILSTKFTFSKRDFFNEIGSGLSTIKRRTQKIYKENHTFSWDNFSDLITALELKTNEFTLQSLVINPYLSGLKLKRHKDCPVFGHTIRFFFDIWSRFDIDKTNMTFKKREKPLTIDFPISQHRFALEIFSLINYSI